MRALKPNNNGVHGMAPDKIPSLRKQMQAAAGPSVPTFSAAVQNPAPFAHAVLSEVPSSSSHE